MSLKKLLVDFLGYGNALKMRSIFKKATIKEIIVDISASCNATCPFCPRIFMSNKRSKGFMNMDLYLRILDQAKKNGIKHLRLYSTAEPLLHPEFDKIVQIAKSKDL